MANKRPKPEEIVTKLCQAEVLMRQGLSRRDAIRQIGVVEQMYYRWRRLYGGSLFMIFSILCMLSFILYISKIICLGQQKTGKI